MSISFILLPLFVEVGLTFGLLLWLAFLRGRDFNSGAVDPARIALRETHWPVRHQSVRIAGAVLCSDNSGIDHAACGLHFRRARVDICGGANCTGDRPHDHKCRARARRVLRDWLPRTSCDVDSVRRSYSVRPVMTKFVR
jgi:hypothetical protein